MFFFFFGLLLSAKKNVLIYWPQHVRGRSIPHTQPECALIQEDELSLAPPLLLPPPLPLPVPPGSEPGALFTLPHYRSKEGSPSRHLCVLTLNQAAAA